MWQEISHSIIGNNKEKQKGGKHKKNHAETTNRQANRAIGLDSYAQFLNKNSRPQKMRRSGIAG